jgi:hypothetical protein
MILCRLGRELRRLSIWIFLARRRSAAKAPLRGYWILLDFLGFSRPNRDLSMGYTAKASRFFIAPFALSWSPPTRRADMGKCKIPHACSLVQFLIFRNRYSNRSAGFCKGSGKSLRSEKGMRVLDEVKLVFGIRDTRVADRRFALASK